MGIRLGDNRYGKSGVRIATVARYPDRHELVDRTVDIRLSGDFEDAHVRGDNARVLPTDTMRGAVYGLAKDHLEESAEELGLRLTEYLMETAAAAQRAEVDIVEQPWDRIPVEGSPHPHAFTRAAGLRSAAVARDRSRSGPQVDAGVRDLFVLKTSGSAFTGFLKDRFTTLAQSEDRILATNVNATWRYREEGIDYRSEWQAIRRVMLEAFARHQSRSLQHTLHAMGEAVLEATERVSWIHLSMPNQHHIPVDLSPYGLENDGEIFVVTDRPFGLIEGTVTRDGG